MWRFDHCGRLGPGHVWQPGCWTCPEALRERLGAGALAPLVRRELVGHCAAPAAHCDAGVLDDLDGRRVPVLVALHTAARIVAAIECVHVALLLLGGVARRLEQPAEPTEHAATLAVVPGAFV